MSEVYRFIAAEKAAYPVALLCRILDVARSSFYAWSEAEQPGRPGCVPTTRSFTRSP
ncbi:MULTISPECIES: hypothetical protein [unclassified Streptomyces]|uniref:hypothetical protein n=1 Tax=unclassified Streptomyces TaxID=2593676 RepID=UPI00336A546D